ncbi:relaxase/mobilization nuclease domain-containing protein [Pseudomonas aeruginosa]|uniref:relaxase/mobilization nuclease domain-containing protein n=1 Tax=Pseudomonas aeruginosa TaxID=287 RepID=UPI000A8608AA|nr:relaxase/mobilization nuclease domain-containing protein [Pseudomonas aeruginosa]MBK1802752.1 relaxase/mobilization nuclease domain-containing protein [Pseudomonas aeruginosa]
MIRKRLSTQKSKSGIYKASKYFHRDDGCVLFESNIYTPINSSKREIANAIAKSIENDISVRTKGRKQSVRSQHDMVSFHTDDKVTPAQAKEIVKELYEKTHNLSNRKFALGVHIDTDEIHVHIVWALKDFSGKCYNVSNDYRVIERECEKLEQKYNLIVPENRISRDMDELDKIKDLTLQDKKDIINKKYKDKHLSTKERMLDVRGIVSNKKQMKDALKPYLDNASSPSDFINQITENGFTIIHNGKSSFSIQYQDQIFKASELNLSYKTLKTKLGEDEAFEQTLTAKHKIVDFSDCTLTIKNTNPDYMNRINPNSVLAKKFKCEKYDDKVEYFYNSIKEKKAFEYHKDPAKVSFSDLSRQSAKAGLQRLMADTTPPDTFYVTGPDFFRKNIWLEAQLMGLEAKGIKLEGYKPTPADLEELKRIQEHYASMNSKFTPTVQAQPAQEAIEAPAPSTPIVSMPAAPTPFKTVVEQPTASGSDEPKKQVEQEETKSFKNDDEEFEAETLKTYKNDDEEFEKEVIPTEKQNEVSTQEIKSPEQQKQDFDDLVDELIKNYSNDFYPSYILSCVMDAIDGKINEDGFKEMNELHQRVFAHVEHFDEATKEEIKDDIDEQIDFAEQEEHEEEMQNKRKLKQKKEI